MAKKRWKGDAYRLQVYHYEEDWLVRDAGGVRRLKAIVWPNDGPELAPLCAGQGEVYRK